jgi:long-subunit fatty acid transport protein
MSFPWALAFFNTWGATVYMPKMGTNSAGEKVPNPQADINRKTALKTPTASLGFGWNAGEIIEGLALGASVDVMMGSLYVYRNLYFGEDIGKVELSADAIAVGGRMGIQYDSPDSEGLSMGVSMKLPMKLKFEGNANFDMMGDSATIADYRGSLPPDGAAGGDLTLPLAVNVGISDVFFEGDLRISGEVALLHFESYDELRLVLPDGSESVSPKNWNNTISYRFGLEYKAAEETFLRCGYVFDTNPIPAATLNSSLIDMDRHFVTAGVGTTFAGLTVDVAGMYKIPTGTRWSSDRMGADLAEYDLEVLLVALHIGYQFDFGGGEGEEAAAEAEAE